MFSNINFSYIFLQQQQQVMMARPQMPVGQQTIVSPQQQNQMNPNIINQQGQTRMVGPNEQQQMMMQRQQQQQQQAQHQQAQAQAQQQQQLQMQQRQQQLMQARYSQKKCMGPKKIHGSNSCGQTFKTFKFERRENLIIFLFDISSL